MGKMKENPRYNVLSCRVSDYELREILEHVDGSRQEYLLQAVMEKVVRDRQMAMDDYLRKRCPSTPLREQSGGGQ